jgi:chemosensory pili system protein ChpC
MQNQQSIVKSLLIPITDGEIILPNAIIAEITYYTKPEKLNKKQPNWLLGLIDWRNQKVPLISIEDSLSLPSATVKTQRTVVLYGLESPQSMPFYAFVAADVPKVLSVSEGSLLNPKIDKRPGLFFTVETEHSKTIWLVDLPHVENLLRNYLAN